MKVLSLHRMGDPKKRREAVRVLEYMIPECRPDLKCIVHDADLPFPEYLKDVEFDLVVMGPTFLCSRYNDELLADTLENYSFIKHGNFCKIALPQDDYDCCEILDNWMMDWNVDRIYAVCSQHWDILYPKNYSKGKIRLGFTGYITNKWIESWANPITHRNRGIDVSYRASKLPANFGSIGQLKWQIADRFANAAAAFSGLKLDISTKNEDVIPGPRWHTFLENAKFCLATPSGSSLIDPWNEIRKSVNLFVKHNPHAPFIEIEENCFPRQDRKYILTAISPRNLESALAETVQIATPGSYSNILLPNDHFLQLEEDCSNIKDVMSIIKDERFVDRIKKNAKDCLLSEPRLRLDRFVNEMVDFCVSVKGLSSGFGQERQEDNLKFDKYYNEIDAIYKKNWEPNWFQRTKSKLRISVRYRVKKFASLFSLGKTS
jgi:hypothetical protein